MSIKTRITAAAGITALLGASTAVLVAAPAHADIERQGPCGAGHYEFSIDREGNGWEIDADVENVAPRSTWKFVLKHDGNRYLKVTRKADYEGDVDVDAFRRDTAGSDAFRFKATRVGGDERCGARITVG